MFNYILSDKGILLLQCLECGHKNLVPYLHLEAYKCQAGKWTIGYGTRFYPNGIEVKQGDKCTPEQALEYFRYDIKKFEKAVNLSLKRSVLQQVFDSLVCFTYNVGIEGLKSSTVLKVVNGESNVDIEDAFIRWNKVDASFDGKDNDGDGLVDEQGEKKVSDGLINRHRSEAYLYKYNEIKFFN